jgi:hypothetical protein
LHPMHFSNKDVFVNDLYYRLSKFSTFEPTFG